MLFVLDNIHQLFNFREFSDFKMHFRFRDDLESDRNIKCSS